MGANTPAAAQTLTGAITAGANLSEFTGDGVRQVERRSTPFAALSLARHPWQSRFGVEAGVGYVMKGSTWIDFVRNTMRLNYIEGQALLRIALPIEGSDLRPVFFAGPSVGYLLSCSMHGSFGGSTLTLPCDDPSWNNTLDISDIDVGYTFGGTIELRTTGSLVVAPRIAHTRGLRSLGFGPQDDEIDARNTSTLIGLTVTIPVR
jgi:hypothetical protein